MAGNTVNIKLQVKSDGSLEASINDTKELNRELGKAVKHAQEYSKMGASADSMQYGRARGASGLTGASARDFANEQQGLGGLVRLYATLAANTYAAATAFNFLRDGYNAAIQENALTQLSITSGVAINALAKNLVAATDGAINFKEAMSAAAKGTTSGLSSKQMLDLAAAAKKAGQTIGIDTTEAISRLTRGITKIEPELLDELGLFTKLDLAVTNYARNVGKSVSSLTDFERRQAFANAVLKEAKDKFNDVDIPANPYEKLAAALSNIALEGTKLVNNFLVPVVEFFTNNTTILVGALGLIATKILGMALPALAEWRKGLNDAAVLAKQRASDINVSFGDAFAQKIEAKYDIPKLKQNLDDAANAYEKSRQDFLAKDKAYATAKDAQDQKIYSSFNKALKGSEELSQETIAATQKKIVDLRTQGLNVSEADRAVLQSTADRLEKQLLIYQRLISARRALADANSKYDAAAEAPNIEASLRERISKQARQGALGAEIVAAAGTNTQILGVKDAFNQLLASVKNNNVQLGTLQKASILARGSLVILATGVEIVAMAFNRVLGVIGIFITLITIIADLFTKAQKESNKLSGSMDALAETASITDRIMERFAKNVNSVTFNAVATNAKELFDGLQTQVEDFTEYLRKRGFVEALGDSFKNLFGAGNIGNFRENAAKAIVAQLKTLPADEAKRELENYLKNKIGVQKLTEESISGALKGKGEFQIRDIVKDANDAIGKQVAILQQQNGVLKDLKQSLDGFATSSKNLQNTLLPSDALSKFAFDAIDVGVKLQKSFEDPKTAAMALQDVLKDTRGFDLLNVAFDKQGISAKKLIDDGRTINEIQQERLELAKKLEAELGRQSRGGQADPEGLKKNISNLEKELKGLDLKIEIKKGNIDKITSTLNGLANDVISEAFRILESKARAAQGQAQIGVERALLQGVQGTGSAKAQAELDRRDLAIQQEQLKLTIDLVNNGLQARILQEKQLVELQNIATYTLATNEGRQLNKAEQKLVDANLATLKGLDKVSQSISSGKPLGRKDFGDLPPGSAQRFGAEAIQVSLGAQAQLALLGGKGREINVKERLGVLQEIQAIQNRTLATERAQAQIELEAFNRQGITLDFLSEGAKILKDQLENAVRLKDNQIALKAVDDKIAQDTVRLQLAKAEGASAATKAAIQGSLSDLAYQRKTLVNQQQQQDQAAKIKQAQDEITRAHAATAREIDHQNKLRDIGLQQQRQDVAYLTSLTDFYNNAGVLNANQIATAQKLLQEKKTELDYQQQLNALQDTYNKGIADNDKLIAQAKAAKKDADVTEYTLAKQRLATEYESAKFAADRNNLQQQYLDALNNEVIKRKIIRDYDNKQADAILGVVKSQQELNNLVDNNLTYLTNDTLENRLSLEKQLADDGFRRRQAEITDMQAIYNLAKQDFQLKTQVFGFEDAATAKALSDTEARIDALTRALGLDRESLRVKQEQAKINNKLAMDLQILDVQNRKSELSLKLQQTQTANQEQLLRAQEGLNMLTPQQIQDKQKIIDYAKIEQETAGATLAENKRYYTESMRLQAQYDNARADPKVSDAQLQSIKQLMTAENDAHLQEMKNIALSNKGKIDAANLTYSLTQRQKAYNDAFIKMFDGMADSIIDFVNTGKGNFSDLIDSFIKDLARYELRLFLFQQYQQNIRPGLGLGGPAMPGGGGGGGFSLGNFFSSFLGGGGNIAGSAGTYSMSGFSLAAKGAAFDEQSNKFAKGGAFDEGYSVQPFAMGAAFTNKIINEPTIFKFAQGTGLMGEAGPEAIMPLMRDSSGNLGVRSDGGNAGSQVNIVINNNTSAEVQTNEATDGRGNRSIEITIGDMVARQIASKNSTLQQTMGAVYGNKPALARR